MGSTWRSAPMHLVQLFVQMEAAHDTVDELGQLGVIQFRDVCTFIYYLYPLQFIMYSLLF